jgi:hypothetical protein
VTHFRVACPKGKIIPFGALQENIFKRLITNRNGKARHAAPRVSEDAPVPLGSSCQGQTGQVTYDKALIFSCAVSKKKNREN